MCSGIAITGYEGYLGTLLVPAVRDVLGLDPILIDKSRVPEIKSAFVIHLGEPSSVSSCTLSSVETCRRNIESIVSNPSIETVVYMSSGLLYDRKVFCDGGLAESAETLVDNNYKLIKSNSEQCLAASDKRFVALRLSNVLGYSASKTNLLADIFRQMNNRSGLVELRDLAPVNDFICGHDVIAAILHCLKVGCTGIFNCGTGVGLSVAQLCELIFSVLGREDLKAIATTGGSSSINSDRFALDINKLTKTGWRPSDRLGECIVNEWNKFQKDAGL